MVFFFCFCCLQSVFLGAITSIDQSFRNKSLLLQEMKNMFLQHRTKLPQLRLEPMTSMRLEAPLIPPPSHLHNQLSYACSLQINVNKVGMSIVNLISLRWRKNYFFKNIDNNNTCSPQNASLSYNRITESLPSPSTPVLIKV